MSAPTPTTGDALLLGPRTERLERHRVELGPDARLRRQGEVAGQVSLRLDEGRARFEVAPLGPRESFRVLAGPVAVEVVGTLFSVARASDCATVGVEEGAVKVVQDGRVVARLRPSDEQTFCLTGLGLEISSPGEALVRSALALVASGREPARAAELLARYRREHPGGVFDQEALFHLVRVNVRLGRTAEAARLLRVMETSHPGDERLARLRPLVRAR
jgi:ferric-dicitrate binding protein FerR (iron transport regulator)